MTDTLAGGGVVVDLPSMVRLRAAEHPDSTAYVVIRSTGDEDGDEKLTYRELEAASRARAAMLIERGLRAASAVMLYPTGLEFPKAFLAAQLAGIAGAPVKVPNRRSGLERVRAIAEDAGAKTILLTAAVRRELEERFGDMPELRGLELIETDAAPDRYPPDLTPSPVDPDTTALLQYTSGSTGRPKGVTVSHRNLCANAADLEAGWPTGDDGRIVSWLPLFHDMGLLFGIVMPLWSGAPAYLMTPDEFVRRPLRWLEAISRLRGTHAASPNLGYELCARLADEVTPPLDLSSWRAAINGSEPVRWGTINRFATGFAAYGFDPRAACPGYGLAENTLKVSGSRGDELPRALWLSMSALTSRRVELVDPAEKNAVAMVSCGRAEGATEVTIVDPDTSRRCPSGSVGEIWLSGPCVAGGYWEKPVETAAIFQAAIEGGDPRERFLRTGDLGFVHEGELYIAGRLKDVIIRFGRNHYPQDIELTIEGSAPGLRPSCAAAFSVDRDDAEELVVVLEVNGRVLRETPAVEIAERVRARVEARHALPVADVVLIRRGALPRTSSGKVQRRACRDSYLQGTLSTIDQQQPVRRPAIGPAESAAGKGNVRIGS